MKKHKDKAFDWLDECTGGMAERFERRARKRIEAEAGRYHRDFPFVATITVGNGAALVQDHQGKMMDSYNPVQLEHIRKGMAGNEDDAYEVQRQLRSAAENDPLIEFLVQVQFHALGFAPDDIDFTKLATK